MPRKSQGESSKSKLKNPSENAQNAQKAQEIAVANLQQLQQQQRLAMLRSVFNHKMASTFGRIPIHVPNIAEAVSPKPLAVSTPSVKGRPLIAMWTLNTLMACVGSAAIVIGLKMLVGRTYWNTVFAADNFSYVGVNCVTLIGILMVFTAFCGIWGMEMYNPCLLTIYFVMLLVLFIVNVAAIIVYSKNYSSKRTKVLESIKYFGKNTPDGAKVTDAWAAGQHLLECCGVNGIEDFLNNNVVEPPPPCERNAEILGCELAIKPFASGFAAMASIMLISEALLLGVAAYILNQFPKESEEEKAENESDGSYDESKNSSEEHAHVHKRKKNSKLHTDLSTSQKTLLDITAYGYLDALQNNTQMKNYFASPHVSDRTMSSNRK